MSEPKVRVYALIIGPTLSKEKTKIGECTVTPMSRSEQKKRKFKPIKFEQAEIEDHHKSYVATWNSNLDQRVIKTSYVIYTDVRAYDWEHAISIAYQKFEDAVGALSVTSLIERPLNNGMTANYFYSYDYQIVKVYALENEEERELETKKPFNGASYQKIGLPWQFFGSADITTQEVEDLIHLAQNNVRLQHSIEYLMFAERCMLFRLPLEMAILNLCKAVETLVKSFKYKKGIKSFKNRLRNSNDVFKLSTEELKVIEKLWDLRNESDVAHAAETNLFRLGYQNAIPTSRSKLLSINSQPAIVAKIVKNYALFLGSLVIIKIEKYTNRNDRDEELVYVVNRGHYVYETNQTNLKKLIPELKKRISLDLKVSYKNIKTYYHHQKREFIFRIESEKFKRTTKRTRYTIFG